MEQTGYVYILTSARGRVLYIGVTSDLYRRVRTHKARLFDGFSKKYNVDRLVYFEVWPDIESAIIREKVLKGQSRKMKLAAIARMNPTGEDLFVRISAR